jgi:hypothetical protein
MLVLNQCQTRISIQFVIASAAAALAKANSWLYVTLSVIGLQWAIISIICTSVDSVRYTHELASTMICQQNLMAKESVKLRRIRKIYFGRRQRCKPSWQVRVRARCELNLSEYIFRSAVPRYFIGFKYVCFIDFLIRLLPTSCTSTTQPAMWLHRICAVFPKSKWCTFCWRNGLSSLRRDGNLEIIREGLKGSFQIQQTSKF